MYKSVAWMMAGILVAGITGTAAAEQEPNKAEEKAYDINKLRCEELTALPPQDQAGFLAFVEGHQRSQRKPNELGDLDIERNVVSLAQSCAKAPKAAVRDQLKGNFPTGKKKVKPGAITCREFVGLPASDQREIAAFADGYYDGNRASPEMQYEADYENDVAEILEPCKASPDASFWVEIQKFFLSEDQE